ncbi:MAG: rhomboid family intramembrane serine protease [Pirellulaceae bacterium]
MIPYNTDAPLYHMPIATVALIVICALLFFVVPSSLMEPELLFNGEPATETEFGEEVDFSALDVTVVYPANTLILEYGNGIKPWQWFTSIFVHSDIFHLIMNMIALWAFGLVVEGKVGSWVFLGLYMGIGVVQCAIEQSIMGFIGTGGSLGASAAIFGLLGIAMVWAPRNEFDVFWTFGFYAGTFELPIMIYAFITFGLELVGAVLSGGMSSAVLHMMGFAMGIVLGFVWLRLKWVDCEGWDLINVLGGKEGYHHENAAREADVEKEAQALIRSRLKGRRDSVRTTNTSTNTAPAPAYTPYASTTGQPDTAHDAAPFVLPPVATPDVDQFGDLFAQLPFDQTVASPTADVEQLLETGNIATAIKLMEKLRQSGADPQLPQPALGKLVRHLLAAKQYEVAIPWMVEHIRRFSASRASLQLNLAKIHLHAERPRKAIEVLKSVSGSSLDETARATWNKLAAHAKKQISEGVIEVSDS